MSLSAPRSRQAADSAGALWPHWPFCSRRCQLIDLGRWLGGDYRITGPSSGGDPDSEGMDAADASKPAVPSADPHSHEAP